MFSTKAKIEQMFPQARVSLVRGTDQDHDETPKFIDAIFDSLEDAQAAAERADGQYHNEREGHVVTWINEEVTD